MKFDWYRAREAEVLNKTHNQQIHRNQTKKNYYYILYLLICYFNIKFDLYYINKEV